MDYYIIGIALLVMLLSCYLQYKIACKGKHNCYILPAIYGFSTFIFGLFSILFAFGLIYLAEFTYMFQDDIKGKIH